MGCILAKHKLKFEDKEGRALAGSRDQEVAALRISFYLLICKRGKEWPYFRVSVKIQGGGPGAHSLSHGTHSYRGCSDTQLGLYFYCNLMQGSRNCVG